MRIGIYLGGTRIAGVELARQRVHAPRHDDPARIARIAHSARSGPCQTPFFDRHSHLDPA